MEENNELEFKPVDPKVTELAEKALKFIKSLPFAQRHPELKKVKCHVCHRRHILPLCKPTYAVKYIEEDLDTGVQTPVLAMASQKTKKGILGAQMFKGRRIKPHLSRRKLRLVERVHKMLANTPIDLENEDFQKTLKIVRGSAMAQLKRQDNAIARRKQRQQDLSRRINQGLVTPGTQLD